MYSVTEQTDRRNRMKYREDKYGNQISVLGYGCMRFPNKLGRVSLDETERQVMAAIQSGVNYFDTAYVYPGSEAALGEILERNQVRDKVNIATKLPHYLIRSREKLESLFQEQLRRLRTDHVDYYLMHMLSDTATWERLKGIGIESWIAEKKACGQIRQIGFSYHGNADMFCSLVDAYDWEFCQIQYNYLDEHSQAGRKGLRYANKKGLPVIIMEPLRGGKLAKDLPADAMRVFHAYPVQQTPAQWALKWLWNQKEVTCVLSGMNTPEMVEENVATASEAFAGELGEKEERMLADVVGAINAKMKVGCTGCGYCMPCPMHVDIPGTFAAYNRRYSEGRFWGLKDYAICTAMRATSTAASNCIRCGKCEPHCPQQIQIREMLGLAKKEMEGPIYRGFRKLVKAMKTFDNEKPD